MKKSKGDTIIDVSGRDVYQDERGKVRDPDDGRERKGTKAKSKGNKREDKASRLAAIKEEAEDEPKKKKRKRKIDEPATTRQLAKVERRREAMEVELLQYIPQAHEDEFDTQYRNMFDKLKTITETFENRMMEQPSGRDVYALSTLYSQMREVIADMRASKDVESQMRELESSAYSGFVKSVGQTYINLLFHISRDIRSNVKDLDTQQQIIKSMEGAFKDQSDVAQQSYHAMLDNVRKVLM